MVDSPISSSYMHKCFQDAVYIVSKLGKPDYFITMTCNPNWPEIKDSLLPVPGQAPADRPDLLSPDFKLQHLE